LLSGILEHGLGRNHLNHRGNHRVRSDGRLHRFDEHFRHDRNGHSRSRIHTDTLFNSYPLRLSDTTAPSQAIGEVHPANSVDAKAFYAMPIPS
jgi:hypothetical protein